MRSVAPDANPYMLLYIILKVGMEGKRLAKGASKRDRVRFLPDSIYDAIALCKASKFMSELLGEESKDKFSPNRG